MPVFLAELKRIMAQTSGSREPLSDDEVREIIAEHDTNGDA